MRYFVRPLEPAAVAWTAPSDEAVVWLSRHGYTETDEDGWRIHRRAFKETIDAPKATRGLPGAAR